ncbi:PREDICTED: PRKR-interacting protein 1 homolog [Papilio xuthus]|uniref:PRKR-interacting protein 1 homolog n=1 Tax=Papilio xuthus TaxID=66420 RepID=A0A194PRM0_PAPXU|nr:PREDICTED: PRKR-interacting protein 1 homolog [Papilio xuthus]KPI95598.1 PRKR-interacting protein 1-like [Papilio xuthus]
MSDKKESKEEKKPIVIKNATDLQRLKLEKLMKNPDKPAVIPEPPRQKTLAPPPDFVRNVMGSSAGAGSGEFHVYRHLRRKEYARQKFIQEKSEKEKLDDEYHRKIEENRKAAEEKTAKKRAKRLKKKQKAKSKMKKPKTGTEQSSQSESDKNSDESEEENNENISSDNDKS